MKVKIVQPTEDNLRMLWEKFDSARENFPDELPADPMGFVCWIAGETSQIIGVYDDTDDLVGIFVFTGILKGASCWAHVFIWNRKDYAGLIRSARVAAASMFQSFDLQRISCLTPVDIPEAFRFAVHIGFKKEGTVRKGVQMHGEWVDGWLTGLLREDLQEAITRSGDEVVP